MKEALDFARDTVPYTTLRKRAQKLGVVLPDKFGGNCFVQSKILAEKLRAKGYAPKFLSIMERPFHAAVVCPEGGKLFYLDPSMLQIGEPPICLTTILENHREASFPAYPILKNRTGHIVITPQSHSQFDAAYHRPLRHMNQSVIWRTFRFSIHELEDDIPVDVGDDLDLMLRVVGEGQTLLQLTIDSQLKLLATKEGIAQGYQRANSVRQPDQYAKLVTEIAATVGLSVDEIVAPFIEIQKSLNTQNAQKA